MLRSLALLAVAAILVGCGSDRPKPLAAPEKMTVYSLDPNEGGKDGYKPKPDDFHKWPVLGKVEVTDAAKRREIVAAVKKGIDDGATPAKCFDPRHGVRVTEKDRQMDYVICFECNQLYIHGGPKLQHLNTSTAAKGVLDEVLKAAKIEIAK